MSLKKMEWKFTQVFGDAMTAQKVNDEDIISAMNFDYTGNYLALGDKAGRLIVFKRGISKKSKRKFSEFSYITEIQSHYRDFDFLKSVDVEEKINCLEWLPPQNNNMFILTSNDKTIKLWKISNKTVKKSEKFKNRKFLKQENLSVPKLKIIDQGLCPSLKRTFANLHSYHVNSISTSQDGQTFLSSDDLAIYIWDIERTDTSFINVDIKPDKIDELNEVITASVFSPVNDYQIAYGTSKSVVKLLDIREKSNCTNSGLRFEDNSSKSNKNFFTEIITSVSDIKLTNDGNKLVTRDFLTTKVWDIKMPKTPVNNVQLYEPLKSKLCDFYENDCIFDKFDLSLSGCSNYYVSGIFDNKFHICDISGTQNLQFELNFRKKTLYRKIPKNFYEQIPNNFDFNKKVLKTAWAPNTNCIVIASLNCLFFYNSFMK